MMAAVVVLIFVAGMLFGSALRSIQDAADYTRELRKVRLRDTLERVSWRTTQTIQSAAADGPPGSWWVCDPPRLW